MSAEFQYTEAVKGTISSMFSFGYMFGLIPAGILGSFASPKGVLATGVLLWSVAQALSPFAAYTSMNALYASRFCMGLAEAVTIPTVQNFVARWVPDSSRSAVLGVILSGLQVGNVVAYLVSPWLLDHYRWSGLFIGYGLVGALWVALWLPLARDSPTGAQAGTADIVTPIIVDDLNGVNDEAGLQMTDMAVVQTGLQETNKATASIVADDATIAGIKEERSIGAIIGSAGLANLTTPTESFDDGEMESITNDVDDVGMTDLKSSMQNIPWREIVSSKEVQAVAIAHSVQNFGLYINLAWLPTFFNERFGLSVEASSLSSVLPWVAGALMGPITGYAADRAMTQGVDRTLIRRVAQTFSLIVPAATLVTLSTSEDISSEKCILFFVLAVASAACCVAGFGSSVQDLCKSPKYVSVVYGITSAPAVLFGSLGVYLTGVVLDQTKSWSLVFQGTALIYVVGAIFYAMNYEARKIFD
jgi:MFS family permease